MGVCSLDFVYEFIRFCVSVCLSNFVGVCSSDFMCVCVCSSYLILCVFTRSDFVSGMIFCGDEVAE